MPFLKSELRRLAEFGARRELAQMEYTIHTYQREFPDLFVSDERVVLLKAELRSSTNGNNSSASRSISAKAAWTPERRAQYSKLMKARQNKMRAGRGLPPKPVKKKAVKKAAKKVAKKTVAKAAKKRGLKDGWYDRLLAHGPEHVGLSADAIKTSSASLLTSSADYLKRGVIKKMGKGLYGVGEAARPE